VIVPEGPPPGLEPPRRRPKAFEPAPPTTFERSVHRARRATAGGDRKLVLAGVALTLAVVGLLAFAVGRFTGEDRRPPTATVATEEAPARTLRIASVRDLDPQGQDGQENPEDVGLAVDGNPETGWRTSTYYRRADLGGLKDGVGLVVDLGGPREVDSMRILLGGAGTALTVYATSPGGEVPGSLRDLRRIATLDDAGTDVTVTFPANTITRRVVVWLTALPQVGPGEFQGDVREISLKGRR
jgi:putative peptidoglycan lipid II flippase